MFEDVIVLMAEDDPGHAGLIEKNLKRSGISNHIIHFKDGKEILDFLYGKSESPKFQKGEAYLILLDIRMPKIDGIEVLKKIKEDDNLQPIPVIMITTTSDPKDIETCYRLGCSNYISKPIDYAKFIDAIGKLGYFLRIVTVPKIDGKE